MENKTDGICKRCNGKGCIACDARKLPKQDIQFLQEFED